MNDRFSPMEVLKGAEINAMAAVIARSIIEFNPNPDTAVVAGAIYMVIKAEPELMHMISALLPAASRAAAH